MITENLSTLKIHKLTQAQYNRELAAGRIDESALYLTPEEAINLSEYITINEANNTYETKSDASLKLDKSKTYTDEQIALIKEYADGLVNGEVSLDHSHDDKYYTEEEIDIKFDEINTSISNKVDSNHNHDDAYDEKGAADAALSSAQSYTDSAVTTAKSELLGGATTDYNTLNKIGILIEGNKSEIEELKKAISGKADATHNHDNSYDAKGSADTALESAKAYSDEGIAKLLNNSTDAVDSIYELRDAMQENADAIDALNSIASGKSDKDHSHDDRYYTEEEIDTKLSAINTSITNITSGTTIVEKATYATNASSAETANTASSAETATNAINSVNATKATQDASGNVITTTYETKSDAENKLNQSKAYTDDKVKDLVSTIAMSNAIDKAKSEAVDDAKTETDTQVNALANGQVKANTDAISAIKDDSNIDSFADVVAELAKKQNAGDYATKSEVKEVSDSFSEYKNTHVNDYTNSQIDEKIKTIADNVSKLDETYATDKELSDAIKAEVNRSNEAYAAKSVEYSKLDVNTFNQHEVLFDTHVGDATHVNSTEKDNWNEAKAHADSLHAPTNAQENIIETIKVNDVALSVSDKTINIAVPTDYLTANDITNKVDKSTTLAGYGITDAYTTNTIDSLLNEKVDKVSGKGLSSNDLTNTLKQNYDYAYTHSQELHADANAQVNIIESIKVNGTALPVTDKAVNITVPTNNNQLANGAGYLVANDISSKADKATTLSGYGITNAYTDEQVDKKFDDFVKAYITADENGTIDKLNEIASWIADDKAGATKLIADVDANKQKLENIENGAQVNDIETIKVNGAALTVSNKSVNIAVPTGELASKDNITESDLDSNLATKINDKVDKVSGKGLSTNDLTDELKDKYDTAQANIIETIKVNNVALTPDSSKSVNIAVPTDYVSIDVFNTHKDVNHAPSNAQANVIETIKVNNTALTVSNKSVNITVPTDYLTDDDIKNKADKATTLAGYGITDAISNITFDTHTQNHAPSNAQANVIEEIKVNGSKVTPTNKSVNITVPTDYLTANDITNKADKSTTLAGYGITNAYTKDEIDNTIKKKQDKLTFDSIPTNNSTNPVTSGGVYSKLAEKQDAITGAATTIASSNLTTNKVLISNSSGKVNASSVTSTELGYLSGVTSNIQEQIDGHSHLYAGSSSAGGAANFSNKIATYKSGSTTSTYGEQYPIYAQWITNNRAKFICDNYTTETDYAWKLADSSGLLSVGSTSKPIYFSNGAPSVCTYLDLNTTGSAATLTTARTIQTDLSSTNANSFDGSQNITTGVTGTLGLGNGGTGATTAADALTNLGLTATATELNYMDGVTSNVQTQIDSKMSASNPTGTGYFSLNRKANTDAALYSVAMGRSTTATGMSSHAVGGYTTASGSNSHAEGYESTASGNYSHAEGDDTTASGSGAHSEGGQTKAEGNYSHAEGYYTTANSKHQHVQGRYNVLDTGTATTDGAYSHIVGNGSSSSNRSNAHTLDWSGNAWFAGDVYVGSTYGTNKDEGSKKLATLPKSVTVTLSASGWTENQQVVTVSGILADETAQLIQPMPASASMTAYYDSCVKCISQAADSLTFSADTTPNSDLIVYVVIQEVQSI